MKHSQSTVTTFHLGVRNTFYESISYLLFYIFKELLWKKQSRNSVGDMYFLKSIKTT